MLTPLNPVAVLPKVADDRIALPEAKREDRIGTVHRTLDADPLHSRRLFEDSGAERRTDKRQAILEAQCGVNISGPYRNGLVTPSACGFNNP